MDNGNIAQRLYILIHDLNQVAPGTDTRTAWAEVFGLGEPGAPELYSLLGESMKLASEAKAQVLAVAPVFEIMASKWVSEVSAAFLTQNLLGQIETFTTKITMESRNYLLAASQIIDTVQKDLTETEIKKIIEKLEGMIIDIENSDLEDKVQEYCIESINQIIKNLRRYSITGKVPVIKAIESTFGHILVDSDFRESMNSPAGSKFMEGLHAAASLVTVVSPLFPLALTAIGVDPSNLLPSN